MRKESRFPFKGRFWQFLPLHLDFASRAPSLIVYCMNVSSHAATGTNQVRELVVSKSAYLQGLQCPMLLRLRYNDPDQILAPDQLVRIFSISSRTEARDSS